MKKLLCILIISFLIPEGLFCQASRNLQLFTARIIDGDTIACIDIPEIFILPRKKFRNKREEVKYWKLVRDLKITYPYAVLANQKLIELNAHFVVLKSEKEKKVYTKQVEQNLRKEYEDELTQLTFSQGRLLIKLIDRETGQTTYSLVKELRGTFQAVFWQTIAKIFGSNLKAEYDPKGDDKLIEELLQKIMKGYF